MDRDYILLKPIYVEREGYNRLVPAGKLVSFSDEAAMVLIEKHLIRIADKSDVQFFQRRGGRRRDRELDKLPEIL